jgi:ribonuclease HI
MSAPPTRRRPRPLKIFFDGGCRPNPGAIEVAVVVRGVVRFFDDLGVGSSEGAEWLALRMALRVAQSMEEAEFDLVGDCAGVIAQASGLARRRSGAAAAHEARFRESAAAGGPRRIRWIARTQNLAGIALERRRAGAG